MNLNNDIDTRNINQKNGANEPDFDRDCNNELERDSDNNYQQKEANLNGVD